jgi:hypothetical protein
MPGSVIRHGACAERSESVFVRFIKINGLRAFGVFVAKVYE